MALNIDKHVEEHRLMAIRYSDKTVVTACPADFGSVINCSVTKTSPVDADQIGLMDSAASNIQKKLSWANVKSTLNAVYVMLAGAPGGQTLIGGTAASENLTLMSTSNSTKGAVILGGDIRMDKTITASETTGAQTINKTCGSVNFAAEATSLVVTNSLVTTSSVIVATVSTVDATMTSVIAVAASGSFTLTANAAATAETRVNFIVVN